ncbi:uncharacterized protein LOC115789778 isoform X2 [Archocentrus centrarchus]|uniref:uncharacterized protein LOC115789778 isoform X2 n=1 Tax=Archocentrus centrarchus TaxID=63155 RepID=UPI0011E9DA93|nr:uncharacterized protein LOC115789778 isoform X2 [Archocentrus centrarchus]
MFSISPKKCMLLRSKVAISFQNHLLNTQWKMRNLILLAVILHLAIIIKEINGQVLGDIISYERTCPCIGAVIYKHFAIFRGGPNTDQNIFHHTTWHISRMVCKKTLPEGTKFLPNTG